MFRITMLSTSSASRSRRLQCFDMYDVTHTPTSSFHPYLTPTSNFSIAVSIIERELKCVNIRENFLCFFQWQNFFYTFESTYLALRKNTPSTYFILGILQTTRILTYLSVFYFYSCEEIFGIPTRPKFIFGSNVYGCRPEQLCIVGG